MIKISKDIRISCHNAGLKDILMEVFKHLVNKADEALMEKVKDYD